MTTRPRAPRRRPAVGAAPGGHRPVLGHPHRHDRWCGHPEVLHGDHADHLHDGEIHHTCADHVERIPGGAGTHHLPHAAHMHVHVPGCGHALVRHDDHDDFVHGGHRHAAHETHYDEH